LVTEIAERGSGGVRVAALDDPAAPVEVASYAEGRVVSAVAADGEHVYLRDVSCQVQRLGPHDGAPLGSAASSERLGIVEAAATSDTHVYLALARSPLFAACAVDGQ
jgi:hypothetical protein